MRLCSYKFLCEQFIWNAHYFLYFCRQSEKFWKLVSYTNTAFPNMLALIFNDTSEHEAAYWLSCIVYDENIECRLDEENCTNCETELTLDWKSQTDEKPFLEDFVTLVEGSKALWTNSPVGMHKKYTTWTCSSIVIHVHSIVKNLSSVFDFMKNYNYLTQQMSLLGETSLKKLIFLVKELAILCFL